MKIFFIIPSLGAGGAERVGVLLAQGLYERGKEVKVFSNLSMRKDYQLPNGIETVDIGFLGNNKICRWVKTISLIRTYSKQHNPDIVIGVMSLCSLLGYVATIGLGIPVVETIHSSLEKPRYAPMSLWEKFYKFYLSRVYDVVTILTEADKKVIDRRLKNVIVMPNPLSIVPTKTFIRKNNTVLAAGRLDDWHYKGFDVLIRAWALVNGNLRIDNGQLSYKGESWKLQIAGTGSEESQNYLKQLCKENGVEDSVEFLGFRKDVEKLYQDASIFVLSSRYEGFGLVLIEAMSQGCACVTCDYKGRQREILNPTLTFPEGEGKTSQGIEVCENGILCEPDDVESLAAGIQKMIEDDEYRESVRRNAIERSDYYSLDNTMDRWESLLLQLTKIETPC